MAVIMITGGTGLIGKRLSQMLLDRAYNVIVLSRRPAMFNPVTGKTLPNFSHACWNVEKNEMDNEALARADYIIHLAGANVAEKRWTKPRKKEITESRTKSSALIVKMLKENKNNVKAVISASAIGWYGTDSKESKQPGFIEDASPDSDFLGETCRLWEESIGAVEQYGIRLVKLRTGIVLSNDGGAFTEFKKPLKYGIAAILGNGDQMISWIHIDDICRMYIYAMENNIAGTFNAVAPLPVANKTLTLALAKKLRGKYFIPVYIPSFFLKLMLGEMSVEVLKSAAVSSQKIQSTGFQFLFPSLDAALHDLCAK